jgi:hypothetical protein
MVIPGFSVQLGRARTPLREWGEGATASLNACNVLAEARFETRDVAEHRVVSSLDARRAAVRVAQVLTVAAAVHGPLTVGAGLRGSVCVL